MVKIKKDIDKGIAYLKKNGLRAAAKRLGRKVKLSRRVDYGRWLEEHRRQRKMRLREFSPEYIGRIARRIRVAVLEGDGHISEVNPASAKNSGRIAKNFPAAVQDDEYFLLINAGDILEQDAKEAYAAAVLAHPQADLLYCDSDEISGEAGNVRGGSGENAGADGKRRKSEGRFCRPHCKPDFDWIYLQSTDYIGSGFLVSGHLVKKLGAPDNLYGYLLRCAKQAQEIVHVPEILCHCISHGRQKVAYRLPDEAGETMVTAAETVQRPLVSILIPNKDHKEDLEKCIASIRRYGGYAPYEIVILENNSVSPEIFSFYEELKSEKDVRVIRYEGDFNFSKINNFGARQAKGEYLLFLNNDTEMTSEGCIREMMNYAALPEAGAVGALLFYGDDTVQHAGVVIGYGGLAGHAFEGRERQKAMQTQEIACARCCSAVTAACMMVQRSLFEALGGFEERLGVAYNDIDLCLRIGKAGKKVIYTPHAQLYHYESRTRGLELTNEKAARIRRETAFFQERWKELLESGDPYYNPNLTLEKPDFSLKI